MSQTNVDSKKPTISVVMFGTEKENDRYIVETNDNMSSEQITNIEPIIQLDKNILSILSKDDILHTDNGEIKMKSVAFKRIEEKRQERHASNKIQSDKSR